MGYFHTRKNGKHEFVSLLQQSEVKEGWWDKIGRTGVQVRAPIDDDTVDHRRAAQARSDSL